MGVLGIMAVPRNRGKVRFAEDLFFRQLIQVARYKGLQAYVFSPEDMDLAARRIKGYVPSETQWRYGSVPWPDVVYNRIFYPSGRVGALMGAVDRVLESRQIVPFGRSFRRKSELYQIVSAEPALSELVPDTRPLTGENALRAMTKRHKVLYLKPDRGSCGSGIIQVKHAGDSYIVKDSKNGYWRTVSATGVFQGIQPYIRGRSYLVQEGLPLTVSGRPFDIRVLVQKDGTAKWKLTGAAMRIGRDGTITSNLHTGGNAVRLDVALRDAFGPQGVGMESTIYETALKLVELLDRHLGPLGEVGVDMGAEASGRLWFIEANSKPGRDVFLRTNDEAARRLSLERPLDYAIYLIGKKGGART